MTTYARFLHSILFVWCVLAYFSGDMLVMILCIFSVLNEFVSVYGKSLSLRQLHDLWIISTQPESRYNWHSNSYLFEVFSAICVKNSAISVGGQIPTPDCVNNFRNCCSLHIISVSLDEDAHCTQLTKVRKSETNNDERENNGEKHAWICKLVFCLGRRKFKVGRCIR